MKFTHHDSLMKAELVTARFWDLIAIRVPWLVVGLFGGLLASLVVSRFELTLQQTLSLAFFMPVIAYMSDAIGTQTETIFIRALTNLKFNIANYISREIVVGAVTGSIMGIITGIFASLLASSSTVGLVVGFSLFLSMSVATGLACVTPLILRFFGKDPAVGAGPFTTAVQDVVSLTIYFLVATLLL